MHTTSKTERLSATDAAKRLQVSPRTFDTMVAEGLFTATQDFDGGKRFFFTDELDCWIEAIGTPEERRERLRDFRIRKRRIKK